MQNTKTPKSKVGILAHQSIKELSDKYIMNTYKRLPIVIEKGEGVYLFDEEGKKYLDFVAGIAVNCLGYKNKKFINALTSQAELFNHCSNLYYIRQQAELAQILVENTCFDKVFFCNSGAESVESALKLCRKFGNNKKEGCNQIISMKNSFHGRTLGAVTATGQDKYHKGFQPLLSNILYAEYNNIDSVKELITENTCAILVEPIQGEGGVIPAKPEFLKELREICTQKNILLVFDEVQTGIGRSSKLFAYQYYGVEPDIICMAKGLANGIPIGAMMAKDFAASNFVPGDHASTFGGNPIATACAKVVLDEIIENNLLENVQKVGDYLKEQLIKLKEQNPLIKDVRGIGLMLGVEFSIPVADIISKCQQNGLLLIGAGPNVIRFVPPLIVSKENIDEAIEKMQNAK
jgi:acetylornithine/N-succinyldiaminopimelate aminotransferase